MKIKIVTKSLNELNTKEIKILINYLDSKIVNMSRKESSKFKILQDKLIDSLNFKVEFSKEDQEIMESIK